MGVWDRQSEMELDRIVEQVGQRGYSWVHMPFSTQSVRDAMNAFLDFCEMPKHLKEQCSQPRDERGGYDLGYGFRNRSEENPDTKEFFHYTPAIAGQLTREKPAVQFRNRIEPVFQGCMEMLRDVVQILEVKEPGLGEKLLDEKSPHTLRFVKYPPHPPGVAYAEGHYDRGVFTFGLYESHPGLWANKTKDPVTYPSGYACFFPAIMFDETCKNIKLSKTWHGVDTNGEHLIRPNIARAAMVFFAHTPNQRPIPPEEARPY
ncbi:MAG TPA: hypothetical protein VLJ21_02470 [Candidatus Binatia bacterium]|nr:hypothetical protein [Candidatus Binatia bacterium]